MSTEQKHTLARDYEALYKAQTDHVIAQIDIGQEYRKQRDELAEALAGLVAKVGLINDTRAQVAISQARAALAKVQS